MFLLKILFSLWERGKCLSIRRKNVFTMFVETLALNGGLNQMIFLFLPFKFLPGGLDGIYINGSSVKWSGPVHFLKSQGKFFFVISMYPFCTYF